jgi:glycine/D-amino acid oxidase-like deaminating enzyme
VGAGLMGAAATLALAGRGREVVTLEARAPGHREGSSHGSSRIVRRSYADPHYLEMTGRALEGWRRLEGLSGSRLLSVTGGIDHGDRLGTGELAAAFATAGVAHEVLPAAAAAERWPHLRFPGEVVFHPEAGVIDPEYSVCEMLRLAQRLGARVEHETPVLALEPASGGARVQTGEELIEAAAVVVAAGPWLPVLLSGVTSLPPLTVTQQQVVHFARRPGDDGALWPVVIYEGELATYALPGGRDGRVEGNVKLAEHTPGPVTTADGRDGRIDPKGRRRVVEHARRLWPGLDPAPVAEYSCLYTWTADQDFILDRVGPLVVCSPCSGHGAKFTPLIGEWVADLVEGGDHPCPRFRMGRRRAPA